MPNKRTIDRKHLFFYMQVINQKSGDLLGYVVDISQRGLKIISEHRCEETSELNLKMRIPDNQGKNKEIQFKAKCIWSGRDINSEFFANGFEIDSLDQESLAVIESIINEYGFEELDSVN